MTVNFLDDGFVGTMNIISLSSYHGSGIMSMLALFWCSSHGTATCSRVRFSLRCNDDREVSSNFALLLGCSRQ
jgi:hypothetical protein